MASVADLAARFIERASAGLRARARVGPSHAALFLGELARAGFRVARDCLDQIRDPELRRIVEAILFATAGGALLGAAVGGTIAGPAGAKVGALVGAAVGLGSAVLAIVLCVREEAGRLVIEVAA